MTFRFNQVLEQAGANPADTRLLRHQTALLLGRTPLDLWREDLSAFEHYQAHQLNAQRANFGGRYWAAFAGERDGRTVFLGLYQVAEPVQLDQAFHYEVAGTHYAAGEIDFYSTTKVAGLEALEGCLYVDWGLSNRAWRQRAAMQDKMVTELHPHRPEAPFPGLMSLNAPLSAIAAAPGAWREHLALARGVYLLSCPRTGELYVGSASGADGFWGRWLSYDADGHGGNIALATRERSDWIVSILQVAGSTDTADEIVAAEALWKRKLRTRELGLNRN